MLTAEDILRFKQTEMFHVDMDTIIFDALTLMAEKNIGAVVVTQNDSIAGLWTERDLIRNTLMDGFDAKKIKIGDVFAYKMNKIKHDTPLPDIQEFFLKIRVRHVFVEKDEHIIGLISCGDAMEAGLHYKTREMEKLNTFVSIDYYENWTRPEKWKKPKKK